MRHRWFPAVIAMVAVVGVLGACAAKSDQPSAAGSGGGSGGTVAISGSSTVLPITQLVAERFSSENPDAQISVDGPGTGDGFVLFCEGKTDINDASRPIEPEEADACAEAGVDYVELEVGLDGITVMTNPANAAVTCLNLGDLYALFGPESEGFSTWADANDLAAEVGGTGSFPADPLTIVAPGEESGTYDSFVDLAGIEDTAAERGVPEDEAGSLRPDYQSSAQDTVIIQGVEGSEGALGFAGFAYAEQQGDKVSEVAIDGGDGCVPPTSASIADGSYPLSRSLYLYVRTDALADNPTLGAFVDYYLSDAGIAAVTDAAYVSLPAERLDESRQAWAASSGGSAS